MPRRPTPAAEAPRTADPLAYPHMVEAYDRRTRAAYEVMGARWQRFVVAKDAFLRAERGGREWHLAAERAYRLGLRSTHAYYLWTTGHTALALSLNGGEGAPPDLRLELRRELESLALAAVPHGRR